ncbi:MAG: biopolymer transporter ExbD [Planctomycetaceae bacterium]|nr:biopolymer transporter ExbD [Planctomycetaceae bacterium]
MSLHATRSPLQKVEQNMTPMIDVVFQLLAFFVMTFRVFAVEGDFNIKLPQAAPGIAAESIEPSLRLTMLADDSGRLVDLQLVDRSFGVDYTALQREIRALVGDAVSRDRWGSQIEVELACDRQLHYDHVIRAITTLSGYVGPTGETIPLLHKIKFAPSRR